MAFNAFVDCSAAMGRVVFDIRTFSFFQLSSAYSALRLSAALFEPADGSLVCLDELYHPITGRNLLFFG